MTAATALRRRGKRYRAAAERLGSAGVARLRPLEEAVALAKENATAKFDETIEMAIHLGIDTTNPEETVRGTVLLPHGTGKRRRVVVFALGDAAKEAEAAGADVVGAVDLVQRILKEEWTDFDVAIAAPDVMREVGKLGKILGPRGLMPNPRSGTVATDVGRAVREFKGGKVEFRNDKGGNLHVVIGKASFDAAKLAENARAVLAAVVRAKPASSKGAFVRSVTISSSMGPGVRVEPASIRAAEAEE